MWTKRRARAIKLFTFWPANQTGAIYFQTCRCMKGPGFFGSESQTSQPKRRRWAQQRGVYMTTVHVDTTATLCGGRRETSSGSRLRLDPSTSPLSIPWKRQTCAPKAKQRTNEATNLGEKKPNRGTGRKQPGSRNRGARCTDTKPTQLSKHGSGSSPPVGDVVPEIWVCRAGSESRNLGLTLESCGAITSSRPGRESLMPSLAHSCCPDCTFLPPYMKPLCCPLGLPSAELEIENSLFSLTPILILISPSFFLICLVIWQITRAFAVCFRCERVQRHIKSCLRLFKPVIFADLGESLHIGRYADSH